MYKGWWLVITCHFFPFFSSVLIVYLPVNISYFACKWPLYKINFEIPLCKKQFMDWQIINDNEYFKEELFQYLYFVYIFSKTYLFHLLLEIWFSLLYAVWSTEKTFKKRYMLSCVNILTYCFQKMCLKFWQHFKLFLELVLRLLKMIKETK